ncbi:50S ribosomal protein L31, chloroplastic [Dendrobium catenatum]|uniref:50S ribosomal protein L31 n=1 Tax=Dendrobium catenatum TaxID=906689 RepID=A0A2I0WQM0_9ASPA|nr:50S ribosomal protein L31, chloroplastic [Dendrobium catenatum]PKU77954.1 50S ribosomal protein L31, chloroplastic [Dendrobium catenatum]
MAMTLSTPFTPSIKATTTKSQNPFKAAAPGGGFGRWSCRKKEGIHPEFYEDAKVYCNGELVMTTGGTQKEYSVDVWSGNHPFYLGSRSGLVIDDDQVEKFRKKYGQLSDLMEIPVLKGEIILPQKKKASSSKGKGKK